MHDLNIEQEARAAAAELYLLLEGPPYSPKDLYVAEEHRTGELDEHPAVQAFQRAIDAAKAQQREADAKVLDERAAMYRDKRSHRDPLAEDSLTEWERFESNSVASELGAAAIREGTPT